MIDLDEELARMEGMLERRERMALGVTCNEVIELITRLRQAEKDAARYRWLRDSSVDIDWVVEGEEKTHVDITVWHNDGFDSANHGIDATPEEIDALIDEAMGVNQA